MEKLLTTSDIKPYTNLEQEIANLKAKFNIMILSHYYQDSEVQDLSDFVGDSYEIIKQVASSNADIILISGTRYIAESAAILYPSKKFLTLDPSAGCSLAESCDPRDFKLFVEKHPDHLVVVHINSDIKVKALADVTITSANAVQIISALPTNKEIIFAPDKNLGNYLIRKIGRPMLLWDGSCIVHESFSERELIRLKTTHPKALIIGHLGCPASYLEYANYVGSPSDLIQFVKENNESDFIVLAEPGIIHQMSKMAHNSKFFDIASLDGNGLISCNQCPYTRGNDLEKLYLTLANQYPLISLSSEEISNAKKPLEKMMSLAQ